MIGINFINTKEIFMMNCFWSTELRGYCFCFFKSSSHHFITPKFFQLALLSYLDSDWFIFFSYCALLEETLTCLCRKGVSFSLCILTLLIYIAAFRILLSGMGHFTHMGGLAQEEQLIKNNYIVFLYLRVLLIL